MPRTKEAIDLIRELMKRLDYPAEAIGYLGKAFDTLSSNPAALSRFDDAIDKLYLTSGSGFAEDLNAVSEMTGLHRYTVDLLCALAAGRSLRYLYHAKGLDDALYYDAMRDTRCKLIECKTVYGIWGTFVFDGWSPGFYRMTRFALGRLQYDVGKNVLGTDGGRLDADCPGVACHIPSSGPLTNEGVFASLKKAYDFFPQYRVDGKLLVQCHSWLLYTPLIERMPAGSNVRVFHDLFRIVSLPEEPANGDFWRFFGTEWREGVLDEISTDTSLKRAVADMLREGKNLGCGIGYILFDGKIR